MPKKLTEKVQKQITFSVNLSVIERFQNLYPDLNNPASFIQLVNDFENVKAERDRLLNELIEIGKIGAAQ